MSKKEAQKPLVNDEPFLNLGSDERPIIVFQQEFTAMAKNPHLPCPCRACSLTNGFKTEADPHYEARIKEFFKLYDIIDTPEQRERWAEMGRSGKGVVFTKSEQDMAEELSKAIGKRTVVQSRKED